MARRTGTLERQAAEQASGTSVLDKPSRGLAGPGVFDRAVVDHVRVRAYYPPTRKFYDATERILELSWTDAVDQGAVSVEIAIDNADGEATAVFNRVGMVWFVE